MVGTIHKVSELLIDESKWTKGELTRNDLGGSTYPTSYDATCWCLVGAVMACYPVFQDQVYFKIAVELELESRDILKWNDAPERTFADVRALITKLDI